MFQRMQNALAAGLLIFWPVSAMADQSLNCDAYAAKAVEQNAVAQQIGCNFTGGAWSDNYEGHKAWCLSDSVKMQNLTAETDARTNALIGCKKVQATKCEQYATQAVNRARQNVELNCGFTDSAFDDNYQGHFHWCLSEHINTAAQETALRDQQIAQCIAQKAEGVCAFYASAMSGLQTRHNRACAGRDDFQMAAASVQQLKDHCAANSKGKVSWSDAQVAAMNNRIATCEANTVRYTLEGYRGTPVDACTSDPFCDTAAQEAFCNWKGHADQVSSKPGPTTDFAVHIDCIIEGVAGHADQSDRCFCRGSCGTIAEVTCTGTR